MESFRRSLALKLQDCVSNMWEMDEFYDFTVIVDKTSVRCHRFILAACSEYFQGLFRSQMKECQENFVELFGITKEAFFVILNFLYNGIHGLTEANVFDVWSAVEQLHFKHLIAYCEFFVIHIMDIDNCVDIFLSTRMFSSEAVTAKSLDFISQNFEQIKNTDDISELSFDDFYGLIQREDLVLESEDSVLEAVMKWVEYRDKLTLQVCDTNASFNNSSVKKCFEVDGTISYSKADCNMSSFGDAQMCSHGRKSVHPHAECDNHGVDNAQSSQICDQILNSDVMCCVNTDNAKPGFGHENDVKRFVPADTMPRSKFAIEGEVQRSDESNTAKGCALSQYLQSTQTALSRKDEQIIESSSNNIIIGRSKNLQKLLSGCRLYLVRPEYLQNLFKVSETLLSNREAYKMVYEALLHVQNVENHLDTWPHAATHRKCSDMKHVMIFACDRKLMCYSLDLGSVHEIKTIFHDIHWLSVTMCNNIVYMEYTSQFDRRLTKMQLPKGETILQFPVQTHAVIIAHGSHLYGLHYENYHGVVAVIPPGGGYCLLQRCKISDGSKATWETCYKLKKAEYRYLARFHEYILIFCVENNAVIADCFNTETEITHTVTTSMAGTSHGIVSFTCRGDTFILEGNGSLFRVFGTDVAPINFEFVSKLWESDCLIKGCVIYEKQLLVFCAGMQNLPSVNQVSLPMEFQEAKIININTESFCVPVVIPESWFMTRSRLKPPVIKLLFGQRIIMKVS